MLSALRKIFLSARSIQMDPLITVLGATGTGKSKVMHPPRTSEPND
jgi:hypothetical protein